MSCVLRRNRNSSGSSPIAHLTVKKSSTRNKRLLCPAPAKEMTFWSTHGCQFDVAQYLFTCLLPGQHVPPERTPNWRDEYRSQSSLGSRLWSQFFQRSVEPCAASLTSPFMASLRDPLAVKRKLFFQAVHEFVAARFFFSCGEVPNAAAPVFSNKLTSFACFPELQTLF